MIYGNGRNWVDLALYALFYWYVSAVRAGNLQATETQDNHLLTRTKKDMINTTIFKLMSC